ncbi:MAG: methyltransferase domain-containing protein, partial [Proteobacteria bacterium]
LAGLAEEKFRVTGMDLATDSLEVARRHDATGTVTYIPGDVYKIPFPDASFEVVTAMDLLEHVEDPARAIAEFARVLKPGGLLFFHTFNRNPLAGLVIIKFVEWLVNNTPKHMHVLRLFITPKEAEAYCEKAGLKVDEWTGIRPRLSTIPLTRIFSGVVPETLSFTLTKSLALSYMGMARKK